MPPPRAQHGGDGRSGGQAEADCQARPGEDAPRRVAHLQRQPAQRAARVRVLVRAADAATAATAATAAAPAAAAVAAAAAAAAAGGEVEDGGRNDEEVGADEVDLAGVAGAGAEQQLVESLAGFDTEYFISFEYL